METVVDIAASIKKIIPKRRGRIFGNVFTTSGNGEASNSTPYFSEKPLESRRLITGHSYQGIHKQGLFPLPQEYPSLLLPIPPEQKKSMYHLRY